MSVRHRKHADMGAKPLVDQFIADLRALVDLKVASD